ncbi:hypothetical protein EJ06DRAFT_148188 [Trichodelitschia bisporula]|uniref:Uncharacterized protein n=1 Tax=Trichodelitschia bisporula TaxID=703511 RepID=A0A6G1HN21_9PEZI|nr:hypothetical protein EJ06DRAFT_148188 [Trichodelitschia bisporula]
MSYEGSDPQDETAMPKTSSAYTNSANEPKSDPRYHSQQRKKSQRKRGKREEGITSYKSQTVPQQPSKTPLLPIITAWRLPLLLTRASLASYPPTRSANHVSRRLQSIYQGSQRAVVRRLMLEMAICTDGRDTPRPRGRGRVSSDVHFPIISSSRGRTSGGVPLVLRDICELRE